MFIKRFVISRENVVDGLRLFWQDGKQAFRRQSLTAECWHQDFWMKGEGD